MEYLDIGTLVDTFLDGEKEGARQLIRHEMESMIDPLVESLFKQLKHKFVRYRNASSAFGFSHQEPSHEHDLEGDAQIYESSMIRYQQTIVNVQQSLENSQIISTNYLEPALNSIAHSITDPLNVQFEPQLNDHSINSSSSAQESTLIPSTSTEQTLSNTEIQQQLVHIKHNQFDDEEECDCDECVDGGIEEIKDEDVEDDDDSVQLIEDVQMDGESSLPVKRLKLNTAQNQINAQTEVNPRQSSSQPTDEAQPNQVNQVNQDKQIITISLQCTEPNCPKTFAENELNDHLMDEHSIGPNRCVVKDCKQSFNNHIILSEHIKQIHQGASQWHCDKCPKHFTTYQILYCHNIEYHQFGHFQCSFPQCKFVGVNRRKVYDHRKQHKRTLKCQHFGCDFDTHDVNSLKQHQRSHSGVKPYRCKWPECDFASSQKCNVIVHIRRQHLAPKPGSVPNAQLRDPKDYVEVLHDLL